MSEDNVPGGISLFEFDDSKELVRAMQADTAVVREDRTWVFQSVTEKALVAGQLQTRALDALEIANLWSRDELPTLSLPVDSMNLSLLYRYSQYRETNGQPIEKYMNAFWQKLMMPMTVCAMVLLGTVISAGVTAGRDRSLGVSIGIGAALGILFYLGAQIIFSLGQLLQWNIPLVALLPTLITLVSGPATAAAHALVRQPVRQVMTSPMATVHSNRLQRHLQMRLILSFFRAYRWQTALMLAALLLSGIAEGIGLSALLPLLNIALGPEATDMLPAADMARPEQV